MDIFHALTMLGGLCLFLFGMNFMGQALERRAGGKLRTLLDKMTGSVGAGFLTGLGITAIIQSSSATTVMVVGFVNSGLMTLRQAINVIMGANVGTTVTAWLLSLAGIDGGSVWLHLLKPTAFTPVLALIGIIFYMFCKDSRKKGDWLHSAGLCHADVRHGHHERRGGGAEGRAGVCRSCFWPLQTRCWACWWARC